MEQRYTCYHYQVEDGQFSTYFKLPFLCAKAGETFEAKVSEYGNLPHKLYVLSVDKDQVLCIGDIELSFPKNREEHVSLLAKFKALESI